MNKIFTKITTIAILLFVFQITLTAQPAPTTSGPFGSTLTIGTNGETKYWDGAQWIAVTPGLPGQSLLFAPRWINNSQGFTTSAVINITGTTAESGGNILSDGGATITARGVCWSTSANPTVALSTKTTNGMGLGSFTSNIAGLLEGTTYFVRAYATNSFGTAYGNEVSFNTTGTPLTTNTDFDGNVYDMVTIGTQVWMKQNLKTTHYKNGTAIPNVTDNAAWTALATGAYCDYNNTPANSTTYGRLYNWFTVNTGNLCPTGWHVPSDAEWTTLTTYLGGEAIAGGKLKEAGLAHWTSPNTFATNSSGFTALPGGSRHLDGIYGIIGDLGYWWSSTEDSAPYAWHRSISYYYPHVNRGIDIKTNGFSVRCLRD